MIHPTSLAVNLKPDVSRQTRTVSERISSHAFFGIAVLLFVVSTAETVVCCHSMSAMGGMMMPGGWTMSMTWMRMPGQTWIEVTASFLVMWIVMMLAMMLPSFVPILWRYRRFFARKPAILPGRLTTLVGIGYFFIWALFGLAVFPIGAATVSILMEQQVLAQAVPMLAGMAVILAGAIQFTRWKAHWLACCRQAGRDQMLPARGGAAWGLGLRFGFQCSLSCANLTAILLIVGIMDLRAMAAVTAAITAERLAPGGARVARAIGAVVMGAGLFLTVKAIALG